MNGSVGGLVQRGVCAAALLALALATPATGNPPWSAPIAVADAPGASPQIAFSAGGSGLVVWDTAAFPEPGAGAQVRGARILGGRVGPAEVLRGPYFRLTHAAAFGRDRVMLGGAALRTGSQGGRAAVAFGTTTGSPPLGRTRTLPRARPGSEPEALATNRSGTTAIVYSTCPDRYCLARELSLVVRAPGGAFGQPLRLGRPKRQATAVVTGVAVAVNARGDTLAAWEDDRGTIRTRLRTAAGRAGRVERLGHGTHSDVSAALGDDRAALVAWGTQRISSILRSDGPFAAYASVRPPGRRFERARLLERRADDRLVDGRSVRATITAQRASVAFMGGGPNAHLAVRSRDVAGRGFGPAQTLSAAGHDARLIDAVALDGRGQVAIWKTGANVAGAPGALVAASRSARGALYGPPETVDSRLPSSVSDVALNPSSGEAWVTWSRDRSILVAVRPASAY